LESEILTKYLALILLLANLIAPQAPALAQTDSHPTKIQINHRLPDAIGNNLTIKDVKVFGTGEGTKWKLLSEGKARTYLIVFGKNDDIIAGLYRFLDATKVQSGHFTALGAVGCAALGFFRPQEHTYKIARIEKQAEVSSLVGNIGIKNGKPVVHAHGVFSVEDGSCTAGHVFYASAWPTVEMTVTECENAPIRRYDDESELWLFDTAANSK
jgi:predicted DNA-binding protein with PD1-like motif